MPTSVEEGMFFGGSTTPLTQTHTERLTYFQKWHGNPSIGETVDRPPSTHRDRYFYRFEVRLYGVKIPSTELQTSIFYSQGIISVCDFL